MLPSKIRPTSSPARLTTGDPELPPMMSLVVTKSSGVERSILARASIEARRAARTAACRRSWPTDRTDRRRSSCTAPRAVHRIAADLAVRQAQRERRVRIGRRAVDRESRLADLLAGRRFDARHLVARASSAFSRAIGSSARRARSADRSSALIAACAAVEQLLANRRIGELRAADERRSPRPSASVPPAPP